MKKEITLMSALAGLMLYVTFLAACTTTGGYANRGDLAASGEKEYWLAGAVNPLIGTWSYSGGGMGAQAGQREFKNDGTVTITENNAATTAYYLIKDNIFLVSSMNSPYYTKYLIEVIDNNTLKIVQDGNRVFTYTRVGDENPNVNRIITLSNGFDGYWRWSLDHGTNESDMFMYDWWTVRKDGTYHVYHYMNKDKYFVDRGEFSYYFDSGNSRLVTLSNGYTVTVYTTSNGDFADGKFTLTPIGGSGRNYEQFDGSTFWESGHQKWQ
jgi:hypothetical protein